MSKIFDLINFIIYFPKIICLKVFLIIFIINKLLKNAGIIHKTKIGIIGLDHSQNIGNNLLKYSIFIKLSNLGFDPYIVGKKALGHNISFILKYTKIKLIENNFTEIKINDYDILMVNSDQTWRRWDSNFYDIAFLKFAEKWNKPKFVYATSLGFDKWKFTKIDENIAKHLIKNFTGISVREKGSVKLIEENLGIKPFFVLDPTLLINKRYYLNLIKNFKSDFIHKQFIFVYLLRNSTIISNFIKKSSQKLNNNIFSVNINSKNQIYNFIYGIYHCKAVITDSYHGTIFSIIFQKPFISFSPEINGNERFKTLKEVFGLKERIFDYNYTSFPDINLLNEPLNLNITLVNLLKKQSINYLKKNLNM